MDPNLTQLAKMNSSLKGQVDKQYFKTFRRTYKNFSSKDFFKIAGPKENIDTIIERHSRERSGKTSNNWKGYGQHR